MPLSLNFLKNPDASTDTLIYALTIESLEKSKDLKSTVFEPGILQSGLKKNPAFKGKHGQTLHLSLPDSSPYARLIVLGLGKADDLTALKAEEAGAEIIAALKTAKSSHAALLSPACKDLKTLKPAELAALLLNGARLKSYSFDKYKAPPEEDQGKPDLSGLDFAGDEHAGVKSEYEAYAPVTDGVFLTRDLVNEPPNHLLPEAFAERIKEELKPLGVDITVLDQKKLTKLGMGGILAVGQGSANPCCMVIMHWNGAGKSQDKPLALAGKGVTFDTGGISLKPSKDMGDMKMDMAGAGAVVGAMKAIAGRKAKANVVGIVGLVENMPSGTAIRPADVITTYAGKTVEVLNTDAEGRLVLADALAYVQEQYDPAAVIDLATLTGAVIVALGHEYAGTFCTHDEFWTDLDKAGTASGDLLWRMPLDKEWQKAMESDFADIQNLSKSPGAGSCTAAGFLQYFIDEDRNWAHIDIAGTAWRKSDKPLCPKYASGFGVRVLDRLIAARYE